MEAEWRQFTKCKGKAPVEMPGIFLIPQLFILREEKTEPNMKTVLSKSVFTKTIYCSLLAFGVLMNHRMYANDDEGGDKKKKKEAKTSTSFSLNNKSVKIYPDAIKKDIHVISKEKTESNFFVFDLEGTLIINRTVKEGEHFKLSGLQRGFYTFHLFNGDEEKATGKFEIR
jgi:hypothetical protein